MKRERDKFNPGGALALAPQAWGHEFEILVTPLEEKPPFKLEGRTAVVTVSGPLVHHHNFQWDSYDDIKCRLDAAFDCVEADRVIMAINSPGGDVDGCFETAREIRAMREFHGKPLTAYADGMAASAAYALACAADEIVVPPTGFVGSIGIIEALVDQTQADAFSGLRYAVIASGTRKADGNPHVPITKDAVSNLQSHVDGLADLFYGLVFDLRGIPISSVKALQAAMFFGDRAVGVKLADRVDTLTGLLTTGPTAKADKDSDKDKPMPKFLDKEAVVKMLSKALVDGDDDEKKMAKKVMKALEEEKSPDEGAPSEEKKAESEDKPEDKKAKAEAPKEDEKKAAAAKAESEDEAGYAKAAASTSLFEIARELHALKAERAAEKEALAKATLLASRPDFDAKMKAMVSNWPLQQVKEAVETFPKIGPSPAAAASVTGTRGQSQVDSPDTIPIPKSEADFIDQKMGLKAATGGIKNVGKHLELGMMTKEQARAYVAELDKKGGV